jgi:hypothetical protein
MRSEDDLLESLRRLEAHDADDLLAERVRRAALAVLAAQSDAARQGPLHAAARAWSGVIEPALVACSVFVYLAWAVSSVQGLYG